MTRTVVVIGGTGAFGQRLVCGLAATTDLRVVVAARGLPRAQALAAALGGPPRVSAARLDAGTADAAAFRALDAFAVVDAAGPYRPGAHRLAREALLAGAHWLDLADGRAYVAGFPAALDGPAQAAGRVALTGCSSTPALSCAVLDHLTAGWMGVDRTEVAILPGNRAPRGLAVIRSILSWAGQPVRVWLDGGWAIRPGWGLTRRCDVPGLGRRWAALADTPDLDLVPARYGVRGSAVFRAGLELPLLHLGLLLATLPIRAAHRLGLSLGLRPTLEPLAPAMRRLAGLVHGWGTDRGGMTVEAWGLDPGGLPLHRRWTLVAEAGDGPAIPTLPALAVLRALAAGVPIPAGARPCVGVLCLRQIAAEFAPHHIHAAEDAGRPPPPLFQRVLGPAYGAMPAPVRAVHLGRPWLALSGRADVEGPAGVLARVAAALIGFPPAGVDVPVRVGIRAAEDEEAWTRSFANRRFRSRMTPAPDDGLEERFGPFAFRLQVVADTDGLAMQVSGWRIGPIPLPRRLAPLAAAREWADEEGRFRFDVAVALPLAGQVVRYAGWLVPEDMTSPAPP